MSKTNKIVRLGLEKTVEDLISRGITSSTAISAELEKLGEKVSLQSISRYFREKDYIGLPSTSKIVRLGLEKTVEDLISRGITTSTAISAELAKLGKKVSQPTMSRYLKGKREARKEETKTIMDGHINEHLPADLTALETMEAKCLEWAGEENKDFANRLADQHVMEAAPRWMELISSIANDVPKEKIKAVKEIINQCLSWTANDLRLQTARIAAMKQASSIIDMKLRYALGEGSDGKIFFLDSERGDQLVKDNSGRFMVIPGGKENNA